MGQLSYIAVLVGCLLGSGWLELVLRTRVYRRWLRLVLSVLPVVGVFAVWDAYAIASKHWTFDPLQTSGIFVGFGIPLDEILFFIVVPICSILTIEAVRSARPDWKLPHE
ncbi:MAG: putative rane protein [Actinomycetota bacterium]|jgi:lycopene cyclase domain-containing protein